MKAPLVRVTWHDANGTATKLYSKREHVPTVMVTVGWLVERDKAGVSVCCERFLEDGETHYRGHTFIPAGMVVRVETVKP